MGEPHPDVLRLEAAITQNSGLLEQSRASLDRLLAQHSPEVVTAAFVAALTHPDTKRAMMQVAREFRDDPETLRIVYNGLATHASDGLAKWIGNRVLAFITAMVLSGAFFWWVITGGPHK